MFKLSMSKFLPEITSTLVPFGIKALIDESYIFSESISSPNKMCSLSGDWTMEALGIIPLKFKLSLAN